MQECQLSHPELDRVTAYKLWAIIDPGRSIPLPAISWRDLLYAAFILAELIGEREGRGLTSSILLPLTPSSL